MSVRLRLIVTVGVLLLAVPPLAWWLSRPADEVGTVPDGATSITPTTGPVSPSPSVSPTPSPWSVPSVGTRSGLLSDQPAAPAPRRLAIPALGIDVAVVPVGVEADGQMEVPQDVREAGWYRFGPAPGQPGSAVLAGHVDSRTQGRGAFFDLRRLEVGDAIEVVTESGTTTWVVSGRRSYDKAEIPLVDVFSREGAPRLALITCGGAFDEATRHYRDNVVVYAEPA
jgi:hypothetical protein